MYRNVIRVLTDCCIVVYSGMLTECCIDVITVLSECYEIVRRNLQRNLRIFVDNDVKVGSVQGVSHECSRYF